MRKTVLYYMMLAVLFTTSCTKEDVPAEGPEGAALHVEVRSGTTGTHDVRLFLANRSKEHNNDELHCPEEWRFDLTESTEPDKAGTYTYSLENLLPQWYKMAFVAVPHIEGQSLFSEVTPGENTCDFNKLLIDYSPALQDDINGQADSPDLAIYREVTDGWLEKGKTLTEHVQLKRLTGVLELNLGVLKDQFEKQVTSIVLRMRVPTRMYVSDEGADNLVLTGEVQTFTYTYTPTDQWTSNDKYVIQNIHLLPTELTEAYLWVYEQGKSEPEIYEIATTTPQAETVEIKSNMRTLLNFNGMKDTEFEVRYAGFDTKDDDAVLDVDDDWCENTDDALSDDGVNWTPDTDGDSSGTDASEGGGTATDNQTGTVDGN